MTKEKFIRVPLVELPLNAIVAKSIMCKKESGFYFSVQEDLAGHKSYSLWSVYLNKKDGVSTKDAGNVWNMPQEDCENIVEEKEEENSSVGNPVGEWISSKTLLSIIEQLTKK